MPGATRSLPAGERIVLEAFIRFEDEQKESAIKEISEAGMACPYALLGLL